MNGGATVNMESNAAALDIVLLRTFIEVVDTGGFALAAEQLALTAPAVSGHIKRLEPAAGTRLLSRTTRSFQLTPAGEMLYVYARNIVNLEREVRARLRQAPTAECMRIGASEDFTGAWLPRVLQAFRRTHPGASVELKVGVTANLVDDLQRGDFDVVFGKQCARVPGNGTLLWEEELVWAYDADSVFDSDNEVPVAVFPEPCVYREAAIAALTHAARPWRLVFESSSMAGCLSAAQAGFAVTPVARSQLREGLRVLDLSDCMPTLPNVQFYAFANSTSAAARELIAAVEKSGRQARFHIPAHW
ncbi:DNA-binding transcriptional LysR family regulator [Caballeronia udeis]|uniref:DNA-binding transcriptional LysR family regulator n=2 Tax=Caballeronia udeis TaxID=1232866 RepID=A0ABW8MIQ4_9BURK